MVQGEHRVGLAAAEVGLQLDHRVAARLAGQASERALEQAGQALGQIGAAEELDRIAVFLGRVAPRHLGEVGSELGLDVTAARDVGVGRHDLAPGLEPGLRRALDLDRLGRRVCWRACSANMVRSISWRILSISAA
jgi:hypothetical protein